MYIVYACVVTNTLEMSNHFLLQDDKRRKRCLRRCRGHVVDVADFPVCVARDE